MTGIVRVQGASFHVPRLVYITRQFSPPQQLLGSPAVQLLYVIGFPDDCQIHEPSLRLSVAPSQ